MSLHFRSLNPFRGPPVKRLAKQVTGKKFMDTTRSLFHPVGKVLGDTLAAPVRWSGDALHKANIINDKDWRNNTAFANIAGNVVQHSSLPVDIGKNGGLGAFTHNPSSFLVDQELKDTSAYRNLARPLAKTASNAAIGYLTGGTAGLISAGIGGVIGNHGSLSTDPYSPVTNVAAPAISGYTAGTSDSGQAFNGALDAGAGYGAAGSAALSAGTDGALGSTYNSAVETGLGAAGEQATTQGAVSLGSQVAADMGASAAPAATETVAPTLLDQAASYAGTAGDYIGKGAKLANEVQQGIGVVNNVKDWINPQPNPVQPQPQTPQPQSAPVNAYQQPQYTVDDLVQLNSQAAASGGYGSAMQQERDKILASLGVA